IHHAVLESLPAGAAVPPVDPEGAFDQIGNLRVGVAECYGDRLIEAVNGVLLVYERLDVINFAAGQLKAVRRAGGTNGAVLVNLLDLEVGAICGVTGRDGQADRVQVQRSAGSRVNGAGDVVNHIGRAGTAA